MSPGLGEHCSPPGESGALASAQVGGVRSQGPEGDVARARDCTAKHDVGISIAVQVGQGAVGGGVGGFSDALALVRVLGQKWLGRLMDARVG
jgi:hypothetical protein